MYTVCRMVEDREFNWDVKINGLTVLPRYAYTNREAWYNHLETLGHEKINASLKWLYAVPKTSTRYQPLSDYLYEALLDKLEEWNENIRSNHNE
jgi:hypothetical protein